MAGKQHKLSLLLGVWHPSHWANIKVLNGEILILKNKINYYLTWLHQVLVAVCRIFSCSMQTLSWGMWDLIPRPGMEPGPPVLGAWSLSHWTTREVLRILFLAFSSFQRLLHSLAHDPSPILTANESKLNPLITSLWPHLPSSSTFWDPCDYTGSTWITQNNLPTWRSAK